MIENQKEQKAFEARLSRQIAAYHDAALLYAAVKLGLPDRLAAQAAPRSNWLRRWACQRRV